MREENKENALNLNLQQLKAEKCQQNGDISSDKIFN